MYLNYSKSRTENGLIPSISMGFSPCKTTKSHVVSAHAIDPGRVVAGILPLAAPATPAGAQLDNAMSSRRGGDGGAQVEPGFGAFKSNKRRKLLRRMLENRFWGRSGLFFFCLK